MSDKKIAIAGASGFIGQKLRGLYQNVTILHRDDSVEVLVSKLRGVDSVINLAGAPIVKRWSSSYKELLYSSRIDSTKKLVEAINRSEISHFISTSAIGIYPNDIACDESSPILKDDFLASLCSDWEAEASKCEKPTAIVRLGVVLGRDGGALKKMLIPFNLGLGGTISDGKMMTSWIAISDLLRICQFLTSNRAEGIFNAVSPTPITNDIFTKTLGEVLNRPTILPLPIYILKLIYGEASSVLIDSKEVYPKKILDLGFEFEYATIEDALVKIMKS